jgi:hypothetical protein
MSGQRAIGITENFAIACRNRFEILDISNADNNDDDNAVDRESMSVSDDSDSINHLNCVDESMMDTSGSSPSYDHLDADNTEDESMSDAHNGNTGSALPHYPPRISCHVCSLSRSIR